MKPAQMDDDERERGENAVEAGRFRSGKTLANFAPLNYTLFSIVDCGTLNMMIRIDKAMIYDSNI